MRRTDWLRDTRRGGVEFDPDRICLCERDRIAVSHGCYFDTGAAERVARFFEKYLRLSSGRWAGDFFVLMDWQKYDVIAPLFGWMRPDGTRRYRIGYVEVPKKNGKSGLSSGIALYLLVGDGEPGAEVYSAAADKDQASIVFNESRNMVRASPALSSRLTIVDSRKTIVYEKTNSVYRALSADVPTKEGLKIHGLIFDELHAQAKRDLWDTLRYGGAARLQPMLLSITTSGFDRTSVCWEQHDYARKVLKGVVEDDQFFPYIRSTNWEDAESRGSDAVEVDWTDRKAWYMANPSLGEIIREEDFEAEVKEALESPAKQNAFKRYRLNIWTRAESRWIDTGAWMRCGSPVVVDATRKCWGGLDLSATTDLTSFSLVFEPDADGIVDILTRSFCPEENLWQRVRRDRVPYDLWERQGFLKATPGNVVDYAFVRQTVKDFAATHRIQKIGFDRWNATQLAVDLELEEGMAVHPVGMGYKDMSPACKEFERLILGGLVRHGGDPVLTWCMDNIVVTADPAGNIKPDKSKATERIDAAVATIIAISAMINDRDENGPSVYEERGLV